MNHLISIMLFIGMGALFLVLAHLNKTTPVPAGIGFDQMSEACAACKSPACGHKLRAMDNAKETN